MTLAEQLPFFVEDWQSACPAIRIFVWRPAPIIKAFARKSEWYRDAMRDFTEKLLQEWTTLERFERTKLELEGISNEEAAIYAAYTRRDGSIVTIPAEYDGDLWHHV